MLHRSQCQIKNIINIHWKYEFHQVIDIATVYLARTLGLNVIELEHSNYVYNTSISSHFFPSGADSPDTTYIPENVDGYPNLEQTYWTILDQYNSTSEPFMRANKDMMWCHHYGVGMYEHCKSATAQVGSGCGGLTESEQGEHCNRFWTFFMEACHRVRSLDPNDSKYSHSDDVERYCQGSELLSGGGNSIYYLLRNWERDCTDMAEEIPSLANNTQATGGHLELVGAFDGFNESIRVPGSRMRYQCSDGFGMEDGTNPIQELQCLGSRMIDRAQITLCERKHTIFSTDLELLFLQPTNVTLVTWTKAAQQEQVSAGQGR